LSRIKSIFSLDQQRTNTVVSEESIWIDPQKIHDIKIPSALERIEALVSATQAAFNNGAFKSVIRLTTSILDIQSDFIPAIGLRGEAHLQLGFYDEAKSDADHVLRLSQDSIAARCLRAKVALLTGSPGMALLEAKAAMRFSDDDPTLALIIQKANEQLLSK
jgi:tetratricopeptide (TPR) repeat protein